MEVAIAIKINALINAIPSFFILRNILKFSSKVFEVRRLQKYFYCFQLIRSIAKTLSWSFKKKVRPARV